MPALDERIEAEITRRRDLVGIALREVTTDGAPALDPQPGELATVTVRGVRRFCRVVKVDPAAATVEYLTRSALDNARRHFDRTVLLDGHAAAAAHRGADFERETISTAVAQALPNAPWACRASITTKTVKLAELSIVRD